MAGVNHIQTFKRDNLIVDIIKSHVGINNAIKSTEIVKILSERGFELKSTSLHGIISKIIDQRNLPIVSSSSFGYCWGVSKKDFEIAISELKSKIVELNNRIKHLSHFIIE